MVLSKPVPDATPEEIQGPGLALCSPVLTPRSQAPSRHKEAEAGGAGGGEGMLGAPVLRGTALPEAQELEACGLLAGPRT